MNNKLLLKHFPSQMSLEERKQLIHSFGALDVHCFPDSGKMKFCAFATFQDEHSATAAMRHLHQFSLLGSRLSVEYAKDDKFIINKKNKVFETATSDEKELQVRIKRNLLQIQNISPALGLNYPFPPLLRYKYPPANGETVKNIANALLCNPRFYTQVLHLMNKMNLPPPFVTCEDVPVVSSQEQDMSTGSETESEIETEWNVDRDPLPIERRPVRREKRKLKIGFDGTEKARKVIKINKNTVPFGVDDMFELKALQTKPNIAISVTDSLPSTCDQTNVVEGGFGTINAKRTETCEPSENEESVSEFVSDEELRQNRLSPSELRRLFKNYEPGNSSCRLYIKNLDKKVQVSDLKRIFGKFVDWNSETDQNSFDVCLLKEGRMKGQAFVTFSNEESAKTALYATNGFKLNSKPMVVAFARTAKTN